MSIINGHWTDKLGNLFDSPPGSLIGPMTNNQFMDMLHNVHVSQLGQGLQLDNTPLLADSQMQQLLTPLHHTPMFTEPYGWTAADEAAYQKYLFTGVLEL